jgi:HlyD family secretion protein
LKKVLIIGGGAIVIAVLVLLNLRSDRRSRTEVQVAEVERRDVEKIVTASGNIQPRRRVNVSASAMGKVTRVAVEEGDTVAKGDFLLEIDPIAYATSVEQLEAAARGAAASLELEQANLKKAEYDHARARELRAKDFLSEDELRDAAVALDVARARVKTAMEQLSQTRANLAKARHELSQVRITAEMSGVIVALNVEEGESAIMGTLNNPGTVLLTVADLAEMEAEVRVDETEVVFVAPGQPATVRLDAFPDTTFRGEVREVGNSALRAQAGMGQESVDFEVVVTIRETIPDIRPGLSASVDITVAEARDALAIPIQCLTVRDERALDRDASAGGDGAAASDSLDGDRDVEGVFVVEDGVARFRRVSVGIAGERHFAVAWGLEEGEQVVSGPFRAIAELRDGDPVKVEKARREKKE